MLKRLPLSPIILSFLFILLAGCKNPPFRDVNMPPKAPPERIQSTIFTEKDEPEEAPAVEPKIPIPEGITLKLKGKVVDYEILQTVPDPGERTVMVLAKPTTPYAEVVSVLDKLHEMGFFVSLTSQK